MGNVTAGDSDVLLAPVVRRVRFAKRAVGFDVTETEGDPMNGVGDAWTLENGQVRTFTDSNQAFTEWYAARQRRLAQGNSERQLQNVRSQLIGHH